MDTMGLIRLTTAYRGTRENDHQYLGASGMSDLLIVRVNEDPPTRVEMLRHFMARHLGDKILNTRHLIKIRTMADSTLSQTFLIFHLGPEVAAVVQLEAAMPVLRSCPVD